MKFNFKKLASLLTSSLLVAGGLVGLAAAPANADAPAPAIFLDYETETLVGPPNYPSLPGMQFSGGGDNGWVNYVADSAQPRGVVGSTQMLKAALGSGGYSGVFLKKTTTDSMISALKHTITMEFWAPAANKVVELHLEYDDGANTSNRIFVTATTTVVGWQTLSFDFGSANPNYSVVYNRLWFDYDPSSTAVSPDIFIDDVSINTVVSSVQQALSATSTLINFTQSLHSFAGFENHSAVLATPPTTATTCSPAAKVTKADWGASNGLYSVARIATFSDRKLLSSSNSTMTVNMYAPTAGKTVLFKITRAGASAGIEKTVSTTVGWQRVSLDFSTAVNDNGQYNEAWNSSAEYRDLFVAVEHTVGGSGLDYYFDDFAFNGATTPALGSVSSCATQDYDVRLASSQRNTSTDTDQWVGCGTAAWCATNNYYLKMLEAGSTTTLNYVVTAHGSNTPVSGAVVRLRMNTNQSGSNATWSTTQSNSGSPFGAVPTTPSADAGYIEGTSNPQGEVSFAFVNTNTNGEAARTLNVANPYPAGCLSPAGQTKAALQPEVQSVPSGAGVGTQYVDVLWPHIYSTTINTSIAQGSDGTNCEPATVETENKGAYPHIRLEKQFLDTYFDASWWDGVWQFRDADTKAYLKYIPVRSTFKLTYYVTDANNQPLANAPVSLIVNANYACAKTFFLYENSLIGPDDCSGGGQTELPAKKTDKLGRVSFVLTNTNEVGEAMPGDLNGLPNGKELGTNIKPHLVGATVEGIDMLFAHFVEQADVAKVASPAEVSLKAGQSHWSTFTFTDESGAPIRATEVNYYVNGFNSKIGTAKTNSQGQVTIQSNNFTTGEGTQTVAVSLARTGKLPLTATATVNWTSSAVALGIASGKQSLSVKVTNALGQNVKVNIAGKTYTRKATSDSQTFKFATPAGKKKVVVSVGAKSTTKTVTVRK